MPFYLVALYLCIQLAILHPFYISVTDMVYNPAEQRMEIAQKIFWDDLEVALGGKYGEKVNFLNPESADKLDQMIESYLLQNNEIRVNGELLTLTYLGYEVEEDAAWFYIESGKVKEPKEIKVRNTMLFEDFPTQQNIVNVYVGKSPKSMIMYLKKPEGVVRF